MRGNAVFRASGCKRLFQAAQASLSTTSQPDVVIVGAGHNGLVAATLLARSGLQVQYQSHVLHVALLFKFSRINTSVLVVLLQVRVFEEKDQVGGACKTEYPFTKAPNLGTSTGAAQYEPPFTSPVLPQQLAAVLNRA